MDTAKLIARVKGILLNPDSEWGVIAQESTTPADLYKNYVAILAAIPAIFGFIKGSLIGFSVPLLGGFRISVGVGLAGMLVGFVLSLVQIYVLALVVNALATNFSAQKNFTQALKTVGYAFTASFIAGAGKIIPWLATLIAIAGAVYSIYLLKRGLPHTMGCPPERAVAYTAVSIIAAVILSVLIGVVVRAITGPMVPGPASDSSAVQFDKDSPLAKLDGYANKLEEASKKVEAAQSSGDASAKQQAMGAMVGAVLGGGAVEALAPERLQAMVPATLASLPRTTVSAERNGAVGLQVSEATATFGNDNGRAIRLEITDAGSAKGMLALAGMAGVQQDQTTDHGYSKTYHADGRMVHEEWDNGGRGEYMEVVGERFTVKVAGDATSIDELKAALHEVDLRGLEALKDEGVKEQ
jgi:hypothetical protein